jgi:hypothetical protein
MIGNREGRSIVVQLRCNACTPRFADAVGGRSSKHGLKYKNGMEHSGAEYYG